MDTHPVKDTATLAEDADRFAANRLRHSDRADVLKHDLRTRIGRAQRQTTAKAVPEADLDDLWDNVPV